MANISDAFGTLQIYIKGENKDERKKLMNDFKEMFKVMATRACYYTELLDEGEFCQDEDGDYLLLNFNGCGRWAYNTNIEETYNWITQCLDSEEVEQVYRDKWAEINEHDWKLVFDYADEEVGCEMLYTATAEVYHKAGEELATTNWISEKQYEYTAENLVETGFFGDIDEANESLGFFDEVEVVPKEGGEND